MPPANNPNTDRARRATAPAPAAPEPTRAEDLPRPCGRPYNDRRPRSNSSSRRYDCRDHTSTFASCANRGLWHHAREGNRPPAVAVW